MLGCQLEKRLRITGIEKIQTTHSVKVSDILNLCWAGYEKQICLKVINFLKLSKYVIRQMLLMYNNYQRLTMIYSYKEI